MPKPEDIRWQQRYANHGKALSRLTDAVRLAEERPLSDLEKQGLIQTFEFTHELAWLMHQIDNAALRDHINRVGVTLLPRG